MIEDTESKAPEESGSVNEQTSASAGSTESSAATESSDTASGSAPKWFMIVSVIALIWNAMGAFAYLMRVFRSEEAVAALSEAEQAYLESIPAWATAGFALAVWGGTFGSLGLVLKKGWAYPVLLISLIGILIQDAHAFLGSDAMEVYGAGSIFMTVVVLGIGIYLVWLARSAKAKGWLS